LRQRTWLLHACLFTVRVCCERKVLVAGGWSVLTEKYRWLVADKSNRTGWMESWAHARESSRASTVRSVAVIFRWRRRRRRREAVGRHGTLCPPPCHATLVRPRFGGCLAQLHLLPPLWRGAGRGRDEPLLFLLAGAAAANWQPPREPSASCPAPRQWCRARAPACLPTPVRVSLMRRRRAGATRACRAHPIPSDAAVSISRGARRLGHPYRSTGCVQRGPSGERPRAVGDAGG
jgi:hypothetical protein